MKTFLKCTQKIEKKENFKKVENCLLNAIFLEIKVDKYFFEKLLECKFHSVKICASFVYKWMIILWVRGKVSKVIRGNIGGIWLASAMKWKICGAVDVVEVVKFGFDKISEICKWGRCRKISKPEFPYYGRIVGIEQ